MVIDGGLKHHIDIVHCNMAPMPDAFKVFWLLMIVFPFFFYHMHVALQNVIVLFGKFSPNKKGLDPSCVLHRWHPTAYLATNCFSPIFC